MSRWVYAIGGDDGDPTGALRSIEVAPVGVYGDLGDWQVHPRELPEARTLAAYNTFDPWTNEPTDRLAATIVEKHPDAGARVFFGSSGSEAVDSAVRRAGARSDGSCRRICCSSSRPARPWPRPARARFTSTGRRRTGVCCSPC